MIRKTEGFALIDLVFVVGMIGLLCSIALPRVLLAKQAAGSASAIGSMRAINSAELTYALTCGNGFYAPNLTTLGTAPTGSNEAFISPGFGVANSVTRSGYLVQLSAVPFAGAPATCNGLPAGEAGKGFKAAADPLEPTNDRYFATNASGPIWEHGATLFATMPESGTPATGHPLR